MPSRPLVPDNPASHIGVTDEQWQRMFAQSKAYNDRMLARLLAPDYDPASFDFDHEVRVLLNDMQSGNM